MKTKSPLNQVFIFDVDGTLTPSRKSINEEFREFFQQFIQNNEVYLVTGSDYDKTLEQLGQDLLDDCNRVYCCSGNSIWERGIQSYASPWKLPEDIEQWLQDELEKSPYKYRTGNHIEHRIGAVNFSIVGRNAMNSHRANYMGYDRRTNERDKLSKKFNRKFKKSHGVVATIGGETGIDIIAVGCDKGQILKYFDERSIEFFGDKCDRGGNDYPLAKAIRDRKITGDIIHKVTNWKDTKNLLQRLYK